MSAKPMLEDKKPQEQTPQEFAEAYQKLCQDYGYQIIVTPAWKVSQDTGTWSTVLQVSIGKLAKE